MSTKVIDTIDYILHRDRLVKRTGPGIENISARAALSKLGVELPDGDHRSLGVIGGGNAFMARTLTQIQAVPDAAVREELADILFGDTEVLNPGMLAAGTCLPVSDDDSEALLRAIIQVASDTLIRGYGRSIKEGMAAGWEISHLTACLNYITQRAIEDGSREEFRSRTVAPDHDTAAALNELGIDVELMQQIARGNTALVDDMADVVANRIHRIEDSAAKARLGAVFFGGTW